MRIRIKLARLVISIGRVIQSTALMVMKPDDLIEFSRQTYAREQNVASWSRPDLVDPGLYSDEINLMNKLPLKQGKLLLLGLGGGREAIPLAEAGFQVTGVDFVPDMIDQAIQNAAQRGLVIDGLAQDISRLEVEKGSFDVIWLSTAMYSSVPTSQKRILMLRRIFQALRPGGFMVCQFHWGPGKLNTPKVEKARKALAWLTLGNISYEPGDMLWHNIEFIHSFQSMEELYAEFSEGGFKVIYFDVSENKQKGYALMEKINGDANCKSE